jgi:hypothetical protein
VRGGRGAGGKGRREEARAQVSCERVLARGCRASTCADIVVADDAGFLFGVAWPGRGRRATRVLSPLVGKYCEGGCDVCEGGEGRVERGGERRHALKCLASVCLRAVAVHRLVLTLLLRMVRGVLAVSPGRGRRATRVLSPLVGKYCEGGCDVCEGGEGRVERGGERRHALKCLASVCLRAVAVHRLNLIFIIMICPFGSQCGVFYVKIDENL